MDFSRVSSLASQYGTPALFLSENRLVDSYRRLKAALPGVALYYAVKSNAAIEYISILKKENALFDVCSNGEIDIIRQAGIAPDICLHTHPIHRDSDIRYALDFGIRLFVIDNEFEIPKFLPYKDKADLLIRLSIQNPNCLVNLSHKFGVRST
jgi:ornithine decarboxylase